MEVIHKCCGGLDVHKDTVCACILKVGQNGKMHRMTRTFGTTTKCLLELLDWLVLEGVSHAAIESTGVYWKPVWNILEGTLEMMLVNAQHIKQVPGRKTDVKDAEWIAQLLQHGLLRPSFVPERPLRELRDLTRYRAKLACERATIHNRIDKVLQDANIKLDSVASDILGMSGQAMLRAIVSGEADPQKLAQLARGRMQKKIPKLQEALRGSVDEHHRFMIGQLLDQLEFLESKIDLFSQRIQKLMEPMEWAVEILDTIPGIDIRAAQNIIAEIGTNMDQFPSEKHLASWAGVCPGNNESAGKRKSSKTPKGDRWLKRSLAEAAWAASHTKNTYLSTQYRRLVTRRGKKRAIVAVSHTIIGCAYYMLKNRVVFKDLGPEYYDKVNADSLTRYFVKRLEKLGNKVTVVKNTTAA
jgi:transposase